MRSSFARFIAGGFVTYPATVLVLALWLRLLPSLPAYAVTHVTVLTLAFVLNRVWIFRATAGNPAAQGLRFVIANVLFRFVDWCVYSVLVLLLAPPPFLAVLAANGVVMPAKYLWYRHQVFPKLSESAT